MARKDTDVFISGGGLAGLSAALAFAAAGHSVVLASPVRPATEEATEGSDLRSTAVLQPGRALFERMGAWPDLEGFGVPLNTLTIVDAVGEPPTVRDSRAFTAMDLGQDSFGWNLSNWRTAKALLARLEAMPHVTLMFGARFADMVARDRSAIVSLDTKDRFEARLVLGADGRGSAVREALGIGVDLVRTGQTALAFTVTHPDPHNHASIEIYHHGGPFTLVPLADLPDGRHASAVVWMMEAPEAARRQTLDPETLAADMTLRSCEWLGPLTLASPVRSWPLISQRARGLTGHRTALLAEAAHVMPPIGAQGLNTSLADITALLDATEAHPDGLGDAPMLAHYARARGVDIAARVAAIDLFNRVTRASQPWIQGMRLAGLRTLYDLPAVRRGVMRAGMGG